MMAERRRKEAKFGPLEYSKRWSMRLTFVG